MKEQRVKRQRKIKKIIFNSKKEFVGDLQISDYNFQIYVYKTASKTIKYRSYKTFNKHNFVHELDQKIIEGDICKTDHSYSKLTEIFSEVLGKHAPTKSKNIRGNQAPLMNKELCKIIINKSRIIKKCLK